LCVHRTGIGTYLCDIFPKLEFVGKAHVLLST
jgi:hypothetical protein